MGCLPSFRPSSFGTTYLKSDIDDIWIISSYLSGTTMSGMGGTSIFSCRVTTAFTSKDSTKPCLIFVKPQFRQKVLIKSENLWYDSKSQPWILEEQLLWLLLSPQQASIDDLRAATPLGASSRSSRSEGYKMRRQKRKQTNYLKNRGWKVRGDPDDEKFLGFAVQGGGWQERWRWWGHYHVHSVICW